MSMTPWHFAFISRTNPPNMLIFFRNGADGHSSLRGHRGVLWCSSHDRFGQYCSATPKSRSSFPGDQSRVFGRNGKLPLFENSIGMNLKSIPNWIPSGKLDSQMDSFTLWYLLSSFKILCAQFAAETSKFHLLPFPSGQIIATSHDLGHQL